MKKTLCTILALVLVCLGAGCTMQPVQTAPVVDAENLALGTDAGKSEKFVALNYYIRSTEQPDGQTVQTALDAYLTQELNCTVRIYPVSEWTTKMPLVLSSGEQVDLTYDQANTGYYTNVANNVYLPLDDLLQKYGQETIALMSENCPGLLDAPRVGGVLYGIPCQKQTAQCEGWYFRKDICDKYGFKIDELETLQDLEPMLKTIKENEPDIIPYYAAAGTGVNMEWTTDAIKADPYRYEELNGAVNLLLVDLQTNKITTHYETAWDLDRYETLKRWQDLGYINSDAATTKTTGGDMFKAGKAWMIGSGGAPTSLGTLVQNYGCEFYRWRATGPVVNTYQNTTALTCITRTTVDAERAMMLINLFHTNQKLITLFNCGVEGTHYVVDENDRLALPEGKASRIDTGYSYNFDTFFGNMMLNRLWYNEEENRYDELREYNKTARTSKIMGFYVDMSKITNEYAAVEAIRVQYAPLLRAGVVSDVQATLQEMVQKMYANGLQKIIDEVQIQYDTFISAHK